MHKEQLGKSTLANFSAPRPSDQALRAAYRALGNPSRRRERRGGQAPPNRVRRAERWSARTHQPKSGQNQGGVGTWMVFLVGEEGASEVFAGVSVGNWCFSWSFGAKLSAL